MNDEALFKDPPAKEDCPICFLPMPTNLICYASVPPATISSVPINDFADANEESVLTKLGTEQYVLYMLREGYLWRVHGLLQ
jgi:hypothetical protein